MILGGGAITPAASPPLPDLKVLPQYIASCCLFIINGTMALHQQLATLSTYSYTERTSCVE